MAIPTARDEWRRSWPLPLVGMLGCAGGTIIIYGTGVLMEPIITHYGWTRTEYSAGLSLSLLITMFVHPIIGGLADRIGPRRIALIGIPIFTAIVSTLALTSGNIVQWWLQCIACTVIGSLITPVVWASASASRFLKSRGLALAVTIAGTGLGASIWPLFANAITQQFEWRYAFPAMALSWAILAWPLTFLFFHAERDRNPTAYVSAPRPTAAAYREAIMSRPFLLLLGSGCLFALIMLPITINLPLILHENGFSRTDAAALAGLTGLLAVVGRITGGWLIDRFPPRIIGFIGICCPVITCLLLLNVGASYPLTILAAILMGFAMGIELDIVNYFSARYFGAHRFGATSGLLIALMGGASSVGPVLFSALVDQTGTYSTILIWAIPIYSVSALLLLFLPPMPPLESKEGLSAVAH